VPCGEYQVIGRNIRGGCPFRRRAILCDEEEDPVYCTTQVKYCERMDVQKLCLTPISGSVRQSQHCEQNVSERRQQTN
jgi:hypothetical protein